MKAIITGMNGTVAPVIAKALLNAGHKITFWDRKKIPIDKPKIIKEFVNKERPDWFFHIATGSADWAEMVARICYEKEIKFLYSGSVSVFSDLQRGPFTVDVQPQPQEEYGLYKLECEQRIRKVNPNSLIVRLGWQIGTTTGGNHMVEFLDNTFVEKGQIEASTNWYPACSFLEETANSLIQIMKNNSAGLYQLDGNPGVSFFEIANGLKKLLNKSWEIVAVDMPVQNNQMLDECVQIKPITDRFQPR